MLKSATEFIEYSLLWHIFHCFWIRVFLRQWIFRINYGINHLIQFGFAKHCIENVFLKPQILFEIAESIICIQVPHWYYQYILVMIGKAFSVKAVCDGSVEVCARYPKCLTIFMERGSRGQYRRLFVDLLGGPPDIGRIRRKRNFHKVYLWIIRNSKKSSDFELGNWSLLVNWPSFGN